MKNKITKFLVLSLLSVITLSSCKNSNIFRYELTKDKNYYYVCSDLSLTERNQYSNSITVPSSYQYKPVVSVAPFAFYEFRLVQEISLDEGIKNIESYSFAKCNSLLNITLPESIEKIDSSAFEEAGLLSIYIPKNVNYIGYSAFSFTGLQKIVVDSENEYFVSENNSDAIIYKDDNRLIVGSSNTIIPDFVKSIDKYAFRGCKELLEINIPSGVNEIGAFAFSECEKLEKVDIKEGVKQIGQNVFYSCLSLKKIIIPHSIEFIDRDTFVFNNNENSVEVEYLGTMEEFENIYKGELLNVFVVCTNGVIN